jgi:hypothetical protein
MASKVLQKETVYPSNGKNSTQRNGANSVTRNSETSSYPESSVQTTSAENSASTVTNGGTATSRKTADAGIMISFSIPLRGGLYSSGTANPAL